MALTPHPLYSGPPTIRPDKLANGLMIELTDGIDFDLPDVDLSGAQFQIPVSAFVDPIEQIDVDDFTDTTVNGAGVFDKFMTSLVAHLKVEYQANRITGAEYTKAYIGLVSTAMGTALQLLLGKDQAYWQAVLAREQARAAEIAVVNARVGLETTKVQLATAQINALGIEANYALTKLKLATEDASHEAARHQIEQMRFTIDVMLPLQQSMLTQQIATERAQTRNMLSDNSTPVGGVMGKQMALYDQQITSYQRDAEMKALKPFVDAWITQKTVDEGFPVPESFDIVPLNRMLNDIKAANGIGTFTPD